ncbi:MAG TPA: hypothetical protein VLB27_10440, partial [candidate division Zixibacteria bacterium]|nr:hypothetical protein [candidate division Zixibacteria bacterium]
ERAADYLASAFISDTGYVVLAGPGFSSALSVTAGPVAQVSLSPSEPRTLRAGETLGFTAVARDVYGNSVTQSASDFDWRFAPDGASLGSLSPGVLLARSVGAGAVIARHGGFADTSGVITVLPGGLAEIRLELPERLFTGGALCQPGAAVFYDGFGNVKTDLAPAGEELLLSASLGRVTPERIALEPGFSGVVDLAAAGLRVDDALKYTELRAEFRGISSAPAPVSLGGITALTQGAPPTGTVVPSRTPLTVELRFLQTAPFAARLDSLRFGPVGGVFTALDDLDVTALFVADQSQRFELTVGDTVWQVETFGAFAINDDTEPEVWCETHYLDVVPIGVTAVAPSPSAQVDTLVSGITGLYAGFGFMSEATVTEIRRGIVQLEVEAGVWSTVAKLSLSQAPVPYRAALVDSLPFEFLSPDLDGFIGALVNSRLIVDVAGSGFAYTDTVFGAD